MFSVMGRSRKTESCIVNEIPRRRFTPTHRFSMRHSIAKKSVKGEDVVFVVEDLWTGSTQWFLYCVCDGHGGSAAAEFVRDALPGTLRKELPTDAPPCDIWQQKDFKKWAMRVSKAVAVVFCDLDEAFAQKAKGSGTTVSMALICGPLLTVANVGDSEGFLDTLREVLPVTACHKVEGNDDEQKRLIDNGATISAFLHTEGEGAMATRRALGPLRAWPGGLAISRSIGDFECSPCVIAHPHITQILLPDAGSRLILATDGLWDHVSGKKACKVARRCLLSRAPTRLFRLLMIKTQNTLIDDTTILTVDIMPSEGRLADFSLMYRKQKSRRSLWRRLRGFLVCLPGIGSKSTSVCSSLDADVAFPSIKSDGHLIYRQSIARSGSNKKIPPNGRDFARAIKLHGEEGSRRYSENNRIVSPKQPSGRHRSVDQ